MFRDEANAKKTFHCGSKKTYGGGVQSMIGVTGAHRASAEAKTTIETSPFSAERSRSVFKNMEYAQLPLHETCTSFQCISYILFKCTVIQGISSWIFKFA